MLANSPLSLVGPESQQIRVQASQHTDQGQRPDPFENLRTKIEEMTKTGCWRLDCETGHLLWSSQVFAIHEMPVTEQVDLERALAFYPESSRLAIEQAVMRASTLGTPYDLELDFVSECGTQKRVRALCQPEIENGRVVALIGVFQDISERFRLEQELREVATTDELTGLPNRRSLKIFYEKRGLGRTASSATPFACALIDLDHFKSLNDLYGHEAGDRALQAVSARLRHPCLKDSFAVRLGGDEFILMIEVEDLLSNIQETSECILRLLREPFQHNRALRSLSATVGVGWFDDRGIALSDALRCADAALYSAKQRARGTAVISGTAALMLDLGASELAA